MTRKQRNREKAEKEEAAVAAVEKEEEEKKNKDSFLFNFLKQTRTNTKHLVYVCFESFKMYYMQKKSVFYYVKYKV